MKQKELIEIIGKTQDGNSIENGGLFSDFLLGIVEDNTDGEGNVDLEDVSMDLQYALSEFKRAQEAVSKEFEFESLKKYE